MNPNPMHLPDACSAIPLAEFSALLGDFPVNEARLAKIGIEKVGTKLRGQSGKFYRPSDIPAARARLAFSIFPQMAMVILANKEVLRNAPPSPEVKEALKNIDDVLSLLPPLDAV